MRCLCRKVMKHEFTAKVTDITIMNVYTCECGAKCIFLRDMKEDD